MSLSNLIDSVCKCVKCGAGMGKCGCWIKLECRRCKKVKSADRDVSDPEGTAHIVMVCPDCDSGGFDDIEYFDANGNLLESNLPSKAHTNRD